MSRGKRFAIFAAVGVLTGILLGVIAVNVITRTSFGAEKLRGFALGWLAEQINGELKIGRISGGGLLSGMIVHDLEIIGPPPSRRRFMHVDSAAITYNWRTLARREIKLDRIRLYNPTMAIEMLPGDTAWNYENIFKPKTPKLDSPRRRWIAFADVNVFNGEVIIRRPFVKPDAIVDTVRSAFEDIGGRVHVMRFDRVNAGFDRVIWESPIEKGRLFSVKKLTGRGFIWQDPVTISHLEGQVTTRDSIVGMDFGRIEFGSSRAAMQGRVIQTEGNNLLDLVIDGNRLTFKDLLWLYPQLPESGNASATVRIQSQRPKGVLFHASNARIVAPGTRMSGKFGVVMGDTLYFTDVDLKAAPLNLELLESMMPGKLPVQGLLVGTVEVKGPLSSLDTKGDLKLTRPGETASSEVRWAGVFDARSDLIARDFKADLTNLDLALLSALRPELNLRGVVNGRIEADGQLNDRFNFVAALHHELKGVGSRLEGSGSYSNRSRELDLSLNALPLSLDDLATFYPALARFKGEARGPIRMNGQIDDLKVEAELMTGAGQLDFKGALQRSDGRRRYAGSGRMSGFQLDRLVTDLPAAKISGKLQFDLTATSTADANGTVALDISEALIAGVPLKDLKAASRIKDGVIAVDSARAQSLLGAVNANGTIALVTNRTGELRFDFHTDSIAPITQSDAKTRGHLEGNGMLSGRPGAFDLQGAAVLQRGLWGGMEANRARFDVIGRGLGSPSETFELRLGADTANLFGERLDSGRVSLQLNNRAGTFTLNAGTQSRTYSASGELKLDSVAHVHMREMFGGAIEAPWMLQSPFDIALSGRGIQSDTFALDQIDSEGRIRAGGSIAWARSRADSVAAAATPMEFKLSFKQLPIYEYLRYYRADVAATGMTDGTLQIAGTAGEPIVQLEAEISDLRYAGTRIDRLSSSFAYADHEINARINASESGRRVLDGNGRVPFDLGFVPLNKRRLNKPLEFSIRADSMPVAMLTGLTRGFRDVQGSVSGNVLLRGTTVDPTIAGLLTLRDGSGTFVPSGVRYRGVEGRFRVLNDSLVEVDASARAGAGTATARGGLNFARLSDPRFDTLRVNMTNFQTAQRRDAEFTTTGQVVLEGRYSAPVLRGNIQVDRGALYLDELYRQYQVVELDRALLFDVVDTSVVSIRKVIPESTSPFIKNLRIRDLIVDVGRESWLRSRNLNVEVEGVLEVVFDRAAEDLRLTGELNAVRGTYQMEYRPLTARRFDIRSGTVEFPGTPGMDPNLDFQALYRARPIQGDPINIIANVGGTLRSPRIRLTSAEDQRLSESDLASYLFFGVPTGALSTAQSRTLDAFNGRLGGAGAVAGLGLNFGISSGFGYLASGLQSVVQDLGLFDYVSLTAAETRGTGRDMSGLNTLFANTQLEVGRYWGQDIFTIYSRRLASTTSDVGGVRIEYRFHPTFTLEFFAEDRFARTPSLGIEQTTSFRKIYGLFLFREWGF